MLYLLTRMGEARDWGTGLPLKASLLGKMSRLEVHHIFPKAQLYKRKLQAARGERAGELLLPDQGHQPRHQRPPAGGVLPGGRDGASRARWPRSGFPTDPTLWKIERFRDFLEARKVLLAAEINRRMEELLHGDERWLAGPALRCRRYVSRSAAASPARRRRAELEALNDWVESQGLPRGVLAYDFADAADGRTAGRVRSGLAERIQEELSQPVAVLLNEDAETITLASQAGFRCFTDGSHSGDM